MTQPSKPVGAEYVSVRREPTREMETAFYRPGQRADFQMRYRAMLAASPPAPDAGVIERAAKAILGERFGPDFWDEAKRDDLDGIIHRNARAEAKAALSAIQIDDPTAARRLAKVLCSREARAKFKGDLDNVLRWEMECWERFLPEAEKLIEDADLLRFAPAGSGGDVVERIAATIAESDITGFPCAWNRIRDDQKEPFLKLARIIAGLLKGAEGEKQVKGPWEVSSGLGEHGGSVDLPRSASTGEKAEVKADGVNNECPSVSAGSIPAGPIIKGAEGSGDAGLREAITKYLAATDAESASDPEDNDHCKFFQRTEAARKALDAALALPASVPAPVVGGMSYTREHICVFCRHWTSVYEFPVTDPDEPGICAGQIGKNAHLNGMWTKSSDGCEQWKLSPERAHQTFDWLPANRPLPGQIERGK